MSKLEKILKLEEAAMMAIGILFLYSLHIHIWWWLWPILFLSPDISMLGYVVNTKVGGLTYNLFHHKAVALAVVAIGYYFNSEYLLLIGGLLFAHSAFDRMLGYGLKYNDDFKHTHLGQMPGGKVKDVKGNSAFI